MPDRPRRSLDAVEEVGIPVQRLPFGKLPRGEFAEQLDVIGRGERLEHRSHLFYAACRGQQVAVVVGERLVDRVEPSAGCGRVELAGLHEVVPEDERMTTVVVWARRKQVAWSDDRCARPSRVPGDCEFPFDVGRIDTGSGAPLVTRATTGDGHRCTSTCHASRNTTGFSQCTP